MGCVCLMRVFGLGLLCRNSPAETAQVTLVRRFSNRRRDDSVAEKGYRSISKMSNCATNCQGGRYVHVTLALTASTTPSVPETRCSRSFPHPGLHFSNAVHAILPMFPRLVLRRCRRPPRLSPRQPQLLSRVLQSPVCGLEDTQGIVAGSDCGLLVGAWEICHYFG